MIDGQSTNGNGYRTGFFILVAFILGNAMSFAVFGLHVVSADQFEKASTVVTTRLDQQDQHMQSIDMHIANLTGQLTARKMISGNP